MRDQQFHYWLQEKRGIQKESAHSYIGYARCCENFFGLDLDSLAKRGLIPDKIEKMKSRSDLGKKTKGNYATALRRYDEFCVGSGGAGDGGRG